ncbi:thioredoxin-disulfide reductase [candidate division WOR-1 bacterium RIFCSPLOWO2_02_FULL_46_20]|uniref:Thioredoxin reductase n=2 Tax=Saganbacteria TaxID=1703751 RepID=A0A1F4R8X4_UNCSA|nr:MAG: thioredoxin-disulfide reductase [candidate division WOR-1 bacterium RIFCSPHIGHO2_02_FULL_45_12]OGC04631.1 MAG: thioredoxin-disulfide reductase [candidate division WOR-1 bacterium RIFCSPLOWO2_02_FULL_46_20]OGC08880.1 MAG: thioredoxin-disulfide reductase [candidate division WOR-1 bacterium RIFCSPLOWO2_12_FULL_45_9]
MDLIIIGGGPAGLTAALYALRARLKVLLVEKMILGGAASTTFQIENYPGFPEGLSGLELGKRLQEQVNKLNLEILWGDSTRVKDRQVQVDGKTLSAKAIIIATGTESTKLGIPGEDKFRGRGVSYCATCDGPFYKDKNVMVIGGGNAAIEEALFLTRYASKVSVVHRRDKLRADKILGERALANEKIYFYWNSIAEKIGGQEKVDELTVKDLLTDKKFKVPVDGIFVYIGSQPNSTLVKGLVKLDKQGFIITDEDMKTSTQGVFAAGDIRAKSLRQIVTAAADGAIAAESARKYIEEKQ